MKNKIILVVIEIIILGTLFLSYSLSSVEGMLISMGSILTGFIAGSFLFLKI